MVAHNCKHIVKRPLKLLNRCLLRSSCSLRVHSKTITTKAAVIVAPHPDDEVFGTGGLIALKRESGIPVTVVFLTDGEASHRNCCNIKSADVARNRRRIAYEAAHCIGLDPQSQSWVGLPDGNIPRLGRNGFDQAVVKVLEQLDKTSAQEVYCPHPLDCWPDHETGSQITVEAVRRWGKRCPIHFYFVWAWYNLPLHWVPRLGLRNAWQLDIKSVLHIKQAAIREYLASVVPGCGRPYVGTLPPGFLVPFHKPYEVFFKYNAKKNC